MTKPYIVSGLLAMGSGSSKFIGSYMKPDELASLIFRKNMRVVEKGVERMRRRGGKKTTIISSSDTSMQRTG